MVYLFRNSARFLSRVTANTNATMDLAQIRNEFRQFAGGAIHLTKHEEKSIAYIKIDHPEKKNGLSGKMMVELNEAIHSLEEWNGKGLILYGSGDMFSSGGYLETVKEICSPEGGFKMCTLMQDSTSRLRNLPIVSLCVVHGMALGGGAELTLSTDFRLMTESCKIAFVQGRMGVGTGWGGGKLLTSLVGHSKGLDLLLTGRKLNSTEAFEIGLSSGTISDSLDEDGRLKLATNWICNRLTYNAEIVHNLKRIVNCENLQEEKTEFCKNWGGPEHRRMLAGDVKHK